MNQEGRGMKWQVDVISGDPYVIGTLRFSAKVVILSDDGTRLYVDGLEMDSDYGFSDLMPETA